MRRYTGLQAFLKQLLGQCLLLDCLDDQESRARILDFRALWVNTINFGLSLLDVAKLFQAVVSLVALIATARQLMCSEN
jgi:hypothetical protein